MKTKIARLAVAAAMGTFLFTACESHHHRRVVVVQEPAPYVGDQVVVTTDPPAPRHEVVTVAPSADHVWVKGYWSRQNDRWVWVPGHYQLRPRPAAVWVEGHWDHTTRGWVWTPGHWA